ncbi:chemotaxis protein CheW [Bacillus chungangensis]|uniref:Purine-binding chemotaxis protein CheW n=1 Tax=Bacillus chungangensis TaxID=587633 RepID=A0ABT9WSU0_9BACI|nr:chemotaxis protein CheW [Bacillus chungangensis]MDQ0175800.1 purine-binding chemotaxis protein CheW [Bacillus chungangensis]
MSETAISTDQKIIVFQLKNKEYAISVEQVSAIEKLQHITRVPRVAPFVKGVINLRGVVTPIIDLRKRFDLDEMEYSEQTRTIIVSMDNMEVGLIVDSANDVLDISSNSIEPQPEVVGTKEAEFISGVVKHGNRLLNLINLEKVLHPLN